jgi:hypothetical protein
MGSRIHHATARVRSRAHVGRCPSQRVEIAVHPKNRFGVELLAKLFARVLWVARLIHSESPGLNVVLASIPVSAGFDGLAITTLRPLTKDIPT